MSADHGAPIEPNRDAALDALVEAAVRTLAAERLAPPTGGAALQALVEAAAAAFRVAAVSVALHDPATDRLVFRAAGGAQGGGVVGLSIGAHDGIAGYVFATGQPLAVADPSTDPRFERTTAERTGYLPRALLAVPLVDDAGIIGVLEVLDRRDGAPFDLDDLDVATRMATAATAVIRATRFDRDAAGLLRSVLGDVGGRDAVPDAARNEALIGEIAERLADHDPLWRLADRIGQLRAADPDDLELATAWLDALLVRIRRRAPSGRRAGS